MIFFLAPTILFNLNILKKIFDRLLELLLKKYNIKPILLNYAMTFNLLLFPKLFFVLCVYILENKIALLF